MSDMSSCISVTSDDEVDWDDEIDWRAAIDDSAFDLNVLHCCNTTSFSLAEPLDIFTFVKDFRWSAADEHFEHVKCLENVLLSLYTHGHITLDVFGQLHNSNVNARLWSILEHADRTCSPQAGDVVLRDWTKHACLFLSMWECGQGYWYVEFYRTDQRFSRLKWSRTRFSDEFVSLEVIADLFSAIAIDSPLTVRIYFLTHAVSSYASTVEPGGGYCDVEEGHVLEQLSVVWPSLRVNAHSCGYVFCYNATTECEGWIPVQVLAEAF